MTATDHIRTATRLLNDKQGFSEIPTHRMNEAGVRARIAIAEALDALAKAAQADADRPLPGFQPSTDWPSGVTARLLTRAGILLRDTAATVDITDDPDGPNARSTARCRSCGWTKDHGLVYRAEVLKWAKEHADECIALPKPTA